MKTKNIRAIVALALLVLQSSCLCAAPLVPSSGQTLSAGNHLQMHKAITVDSATPASSVTLSATGVLNAANGLQVRGVSVGSATSYVVEDYGAISGDDLDDTAAFQSAIDAASTAKNGVVRFSGRYRISGNLYNKPGVTLKGSYSSPGEKVYWGEGFEYNQMGSTLLVASTASIVMSTQSALQDAVIIRYGLSLPFASASAATSGIASFAGTAITTNGSYPSGDLLLENLLIMGFQYAISPAAGQDNERLTIRRVKIDCTNGIRLEGSYDISYITDVHCWPFSIGHATWSTSAHTRRTGEAFAFYNVGSDWGKVTNCFAYGYYRGFKVDDTNDMTFIGCGADNSVEAHTGSVGMEISGTSTRTRVIGYQGAANEKALLINSDGVQYETMVSQMTSWGQTSYDIIVLKGDLLVTDSGLYGGSSLSNNIKVNTSVLADTRLTVANSYMTGATYPIGVPANYVNLSLRNNRYGTAEIVQSDAAKPRTLTVTNYNLQLQESLGDRQEVFNISTSFGNITGSRWPGRRITLIFQDNVYVWNGAYTRLAGGIDFSATQGDVLTLVCDGERWYEVSRSVN